MDDKKFFSLRLNSVKPHSTNFRSALCLLLVLGSGQSYAAVTYLSDNRQVVIGGDDPYSAGNNGVFTPATPFADFAHANQSSSLTSTGFTASGSGYAYSDYTYSFTESLFDVSFNLSTESTIDLTGNLYGMDEGFGSGDASIALYSGTSISVGSLLFSSSVSAVSYGIEEIFPAFSDILAAGDYRIVAIANPNFQIANSSFSLQADFTPTVVPVPAAVWLFGSGLFALAGLAKRKKG